MTLYTLQICLCVARSKPGHIHIFIPYSRKFSERNIFGNLNETIISEIKFQNVATRCYLCSELL